MMKTLLFTALIISCGTTAFNQSTAIPDSLFESVLWNLGIDSDGLNGSILNSDAAQVTELDVSLYGISDLDGIQAFTNLTYLDCSGNYLTNLDLSSNTNLQYVQASFNSINTLNINGIQNLLTLFVNDNNLTALDVTDHPSLLHLFCFRNNLTSLNINGCYSLVWLSCGENQLSGTIDITYMFDLEFFACRYNQLSNIIVGLQPSLTIFNSQSNNIWGLDLSQCGALEQIYVDSNELVALNLNNGSNTSVNDFRAYGNPDLYCIQVDNASYCSSSTNWLEDPQTNYSENCGWADIEGTELNKPQLIRIVDLMGRKTEDKPNTLLLYTYSDGTTEKIYRTE